MKTLIHSIGIPRKPITLVLFWVLAFLPSILHLAWRDFWVTNPLVALGPIAAGFWFATTIRKTRVSFTLLGTLITTLLWSVNWLMLAGHTFCSTMD